MTKRVEVAAGVITGEDGKFLLGQRAPDTFYAGYWEFPGGKVEPGESAAAALIRELDEELGIRVRKIRPWLTREHRYEHAHVRLHFFDVAEWDGQIVDHVHSALSWEPVDTPSVAPMLPANGPILKALRLPRLMAITQAADVGVERQLELLDAALAEGLRLVQIREPSMARAELASFAREVVQRARERGALAVLNGPFELARAIGADGVHLRAADLARIEERPPFEWVGASCHDRGELERSAALGFDYALLGPVKPTATHPGQPSLGWAAFGKLIEDLPIPVLALGGMECVDLTTARDSGAHGIAGIRGVWRQSS